MNQPASASWWKRSSASMRAMLITVGTIVAGTAITIIVLVLSRPEPVALPAEEGAARTVAEDSHYLDEAGDGAPTLVEFLDFECEACGALYPYVEQVREAYAGEINYVVRYFPLDGHFNSMNAAVAVEAAAQQGKYEEMFRRLFETQAAWGEGRASEAARFREYAVQLGLDMAAYDEAVADPATQARVQRDLEAGLALGVVGTPTFFLDGELLELTSATDLPDALDEALAG